MPKITLKDNLARILATPASIAEHARKRLASERSYLLAKASNVDAATLAAEGSNFYGERRGIVKAIASLGAGTHTYTAIARKGEVDRGVSMSDAEYVARGIAFRADLVGYIIEAVEEKTVTVREADRADKLAAISLAATLTGRSKSQVASITSFRLVEPRAAIAGPRKKARKALAAPSVSTSDENAA